MRSRRRTPGRALLATFSIISALGITAAGTVAAPASADPGTPPPTAFVVVDAGSGAVISGRNMHESLPTASIAKIMTALVAVERLPPDATIRVSPNAAAREAMRIGMQAGARWPFDQAMASMMMVSANDAAYAIAEAVGGSIPHFAAEANATARRYGMHDSDFGDPAGLSDSTSFDGGPRSSAYDMAVATRNALAVPEIAKYAAMRTYDFTDVAGVQHSLTNHNKFLPGNGFGYAGANGFKTGYTVVADHTLVATALRNGRQCIAVILGGVDSGYTWAASLLDQCFATRRIPASGTHLPPVRVSPYASRRAEQQSFGHLVPSESLRLASAVAPTTAAPTAAARRPVRSGIAAGAATTAPRRGAGLLTPTRLVVVVLLVFVACVALRRRAVKRRRARRLAQRRARAKAMRSGSLPVVDGRYRTGTRVGKPVESRVRVRRADVDLPYEEARASRDRRRR